MRYIPIHLVRPGMITAFTMFDSDNFVLVGAYKELSADIIARLVYRGFPGVYIEDSLSHDIVIQEAISCELRNSAVTSLTDLNIDAALSASKNIVDQIIALPTISLDLIDLRNYDDYTYRHSVNVSILSTIIGIGLGLNRDALIDLSAAAIFHDIGKQRVDDTILNKCGKLTVKEYEHIRQHPQLSYEILKDKWNISSRTKAGVLFHHENEDGSGYPNGLSGNSIHQFARIIHVADVYDALSSKRPYKEAYSFAESLEYLMGGCGRMFSQEVVEAFVHYVPIYPKGMSIVLSDGRKGIIQENCRHNTLRPKILLENGDILDLQKPHSRNITIGKLTGFDVVSDEELIRRETHRNDNSKHILVVDDMISSLKSTRGFLSPHYRVSLAKSGRQALDLLKKESPDLILLDIAMPGMDGIETARLIRHNHPKVPIIFCTALADIHTVQACQTIPYTDYVLKPFRTDYLLERIPYMMGG